jgi:hypothetical protein
MIHLEISNYSNRYAHLNGRQTQNISPLDLARGIVTVGKGSWAYVFNSGIFRIGELICKALAFSKIENGNLMLHNRFFNLTQSEKTTTSYYFGQGLTKLYSEKFLKVKWLLHVDDVGNAIQFHTHGTATSKCAVGTTTKTAKSPDLIGIKQKNVSHIFEAKGNSNGYYTSIMQHAINQVSQVATYNGTPPVTRTACYFYLSRTQILGIIIDPEDDKYGMDIELKEEAAISEYYSFFKEYKNLFLNELRYNQYNFLATQVGVPNIFFGFDKRILKMSASEILEKGLYPDDTIFEFKNSAEYKEVSLGLDGIILVNINDMPVANKALSK